MAKRLSSLRDAIGDAMRRPAARVHVLWLTHRDGQGLVEYSLLLALLVLVVIGILSIVGNTISGVWYQRILDSWPD